MKELSIEEIHEVTGGIAPILYPLGKALVWVGGSVATGALAYAGARLAEHIMDGS